MSDENTLPGIKQFTRFCINRDENYNYNLKLKEPLKNLKTGCGSCLGLANPTGQQRTLKMSRDNPLESDIGRYCTVGTVDCNRVVRIGSRL